MSIKGSTRGLFPGGICPIRIKLVDVLGDGIIAEIIGAIATRTIRRLIVCFDGDKFQGDSFTAMIPSVCAALWDKFRIFIVLVYGTSGMSRYGASTPNWDELMQAVVEAGVPGDMCGVNSIVAHVGRESFADVELAGFINRVATDMRTSKMYQVMMKKKFIASGPFQGCGTTSDKFDSFQFGYFVLGIALVLLMQPHIVLFVEPGAVTAMELLAIKKMKIGVRTHKLDCIV